MCLVSQQCSNEINLLGVAAVEIIVPEDKTKSHIPNNRDKIPCYLLFSDPGGWAINFNVKGDVAGRSNMIMGQL